MRRREILAGLAACGLGYAAGARPSDRPKAVGYLSGGQDSKWLAKCLAARGYVEGRNLRIETRIPPDWREASLAKAAAELVASRPDVLYALMANRVGALAAATRTIPIVTGGVPDPVGAGFAQSLRRPGANITGLSLGLRESADIVLGLLKELQPRLKRVVGIFQAGLPEAHRGTWWHEAARLAEIEWAAVEAASDADAERVLATMAGQAAIVSPMKDPKLGARIVAAATRLRIATIGPPQDGTLMVYGHDFVDAESRIGVILDKVLRGANPAEIPFELPDRPYFLLNRNTARALGLEIPARVLLRATEVIG
jgi:putative tryptophan/tyrosine transport system substrate-binding protein